MEAALTNEILASKKANKTNPANSKVSGKTITKPNSNTPKMTKEETKKTTYNDNFIL